LVLGFYRCLYYFGSDPIALRFVDDGDGFAPSATAARV
jgi:hypothetical protein